ncbi:MAG: tetratricopeptide (TPR) repeat protein, partial [Candidatus Krumholzibacteriia bacterium]
TPAYLTNLGVCLDRLGRREEAIQTYRASARRGAGTAVAYHNLGAIFAEEGRNEEAIRAFEAALDVDPDAEGWLSLGLVHYGSNDFAEALKCFESSVLCDQDFARGHYYAALCLMKTGIYGDACQRFQLAWRLEPRLARVPYHVGSCLHKLGRYKEARQSLEQALEFFPEDSRLHYQLALTCDALGLPHEARPHYSQARANSNNGRSLDRR